MNKVQRRDGWVNVYPNFKAAWQGVGLVCPSLSPMSLGPINHGQPGLPLSLNLENFHQGSKMFPQETKESFEDMRQMMYLDAIPRRHKFGRKGTVNESGQTTNIPKYFVWLGRDGKEHHLDYITSRQFYCNFYERLTSNNKDFLYLKQLIDEGYNLQICGPDAHNMVDPEVAYLDSSSPFGHERVLVTLLAGLEKPWLKYKTFEF